MKFWLARRIYHADLTDTVWFYSGRLMCRLFRRHGPTCQGRLDHIVDGRVIR
jgi:hypothetical protein